MRLGILSDIHCNIAGLDQGLRLLQDADEIICAGDAIYQYRFSNEVVDRLRERGVRMVLGNHEETFLSPQGERARRSPIVRSDALTWLADHPMSLRIEIDGRQVFVVHGSPWEPYWEYLYPHSPSLGRFRDFDVDYVILGHTHYKMAQRIGRTLLINPGSAGEARDSRNGYQLSVALLDTVTGEVDFRDYPDPMRVPAPTEKPLGLGIDHEQDC
ncbi:MAG: metallophosphoesterase family protein [Dehalococcoidia bacterium]